MKTNLKSKSVIVLFTLFILSSSFIENKRIVGEMSPYESLKAGIKSEQQHYNSLYNKALTKSKKDSIVDKARKYLENKLITEIFPFWYDTGWDYNGISTVPQNGNIACGYFVSTTLRDAGINLDRIKLAQQGAKQIGESLSGKQHTIKNTGTTVSESIAFINANLNDGLYVMGFRGHVGFLYKSKNKVNIIHSDGINDKVLDEDFATSKIINSMLPITFCPILPNNQFVIKWITSSKIKTILT